MKTFSCRIAGLSPLLMHNGAGMLVQGGTVRTPVERIPTPEEEARRGAYRLPDGTLAGPAVGLRKSWIVATATARLKAGRASFAKILPGTVFISPEDLIQIKRNGRPLTEWDEIDIRRAVPPGQGAVLRARPRINLPWEADFEIIVDDQILSEDAIRLLPQIISRAGVVVGWMEYRPEKGGTFGRYELVRFEPKK